MSGKDHRFLVRELIVLAQRWNYRVLSSDGRYDLLGPAVSALPAKVLRHQPDLLAIRESMPRLFIGEAKTSQDVGTRRSREQLLDFSSVPDALTVFAVPSRSAARLRAIIRELGLREDEALKCVAVPEELIGNG